MLSCVHIRIYHTFISMFSVFARCLVFAVPSLSSRPPCAHGTYVCCHGEGVAVLCACQWVLRGTCLCACFMLPLFCLLLLTSLADVLPPSLLISLHLSIYVCVCTCTCVCILLCACVLSALSVGEGFPPSHSPPFCCLCVHVCASCRLDRCRESLPWKHPPRGPRHERGMCACR